jgi:signal peptidase II
MEVMGFVNIAKKKLEKRDYWLDPLLVLVLIVKQNYKKTMSNKKNFFSKKNIVILFLLTMFFVFDRYFKYFIMETQKEFNLIGDFLRFSFYPNEFISFSIPLRGPFLFFLISALLLLVLFYIIYLFKKKEQPEALLWVSIFLGAFSNLVDRVRFSFVIDYLDFVNLTVFNLADVMIVVGCFSVIILNFKSAKK